jgi:hypothetical protein
VSEVPFSIPAEAPYQSMITPWMAARGHLGDLISDRRRVVRVVTGQDVAVPMPCAAAGAPGP